MKPKIISLINFIHNQYYYIDKNVLIKIWNDI
jgi:hypothetical protein